MYINIIKLDFRTKTIIGNEESHFMMTFIMTTH